MRKSLWIVLVELALFLLFMSWLHRANASPIVPVPQLGDNLVQGDFGHLALKPLSLAVSTGVSISGTSAYNTAITGVSLLARAPTAGITVYLLDPTGKENFFIYNKEATTTSGATLYVYVVSGVSVYSDTGYFGSGTSAFIVAGTALQKTLVIWSPAAHEYCIKTSGSPSTTW